MHLFLVNSKVVWQNFAEENICIETDWIIKDTEHVPQPVICLS